MKRPYRDELAALPSVYLRALETDAALLELWRDIGSRPTVFVGSGGALAVAHLAAALFVDAFSQQSQACTALEALSLPFLPASAAMLLSASAKHPDAALVLEAFRRRLFGSCAVLTQRDPADLQDKAGPDCAIVQLPAPALKDGFLATGSVMQMAVALIRAAKGTADLPQALDMDFEPSKDVKSEVVVLHPPTLRAVATDIEVRLVESGLAPVHVSDYRNFAHGRHTGLARRLHNATVIALSDIGTRDLAEGTIACLPPQLDVRDWHERDTWPFSVPRLLARSMVFAAELGEAAGVDVARPSVPQFGRDLYHLPLKRRVRFARSDAVERKLRANQHAGTPVDRDAVERARAAWRQTLGDTRLGGIALDYDGTVCWTSQRYSLPGQLIQARMAELLEAGMYLGFASGRGQSLYNDLRTWVPPGAWSQVTLGLYNGSIVLTLADELSEHEELRDRTVWSQSVVEALMGRFSDAGVSERGCQVSLSLGSGSAATASAVRAALSEAGTKATVVASGHSVDVLPPGTSKTAVIAQLRLHTGGEILAVGDQGQIDGNDYELLSHGAPALTVDRCSPALDRCWFDGDGRIVGPDLLARYLGNIRRRSGAFAYSVSDGH